MAFLAQKDGRIERIKWLIIDDPEAIFAMNGIRYCSEVAINPALNILR